MLHRVGGPVQRHVEEAEGQVRSCRLDALLVPRVLSLVYIQLFLRVNYVFLRLTWKRSWLYM